MDKKNTFIGVALIVAAAALFLWDNDRQKQYRDAHPPKPAAPAVAAASPAIAPAGVSPVASAVSAANDVGVAPASGKIVTLENAHLRLNIDTRGGGLRTIALKKSADSLANSKNPEANPYLFNAEGNVPALALSIDEGGKIGVPLTPIFSVNEAESTAGVIVLEAELANGLRIIRTYGFALQNDVDAQKIDPNQITFSTRFRAGSSAGAGAMKVRLNTGTLPQSPGDTGNQFLGIATYDGDTFEKTAFSKFTDSKGFLGIGANTAPPYILQTRTSEKQWQWVSVTNQFFAGIIRFNDDARTKVSDFYIHPIHEITLVAGVPTPTVTTLTGDIGFNIPALKPGEEIALGATYYVGPREYKRLADLGGGQEKTVQFGHLFIVISVDFLCKMLVVALSALHAMLPAGAWSWGFAIILLTVIIKVITWPLVMTQQRSAERMRRFQEPMKAIREKYKDDPAKINKAMMELYREHRINPFAGCFPVLIQIPIFTGLFFTFQSLAQLRFQSFLWIPDLSMPDVIPGLETIAGFPIHILPVFMGVTMLLNMRLTPMPNVEGQQKMIFYAMMIMFPVICYGMPSALMLYYSVQNVLTIFQTFVTRRKMRKEVAAEPVVIDVTPVKKKKKKA